MSLRERKIENSVANVEEGLQYIYREQCRKKTHEQMYKPDTKNEAKRLRAITIAITLYKVSIKGL